MITFKEFRQLNELAYKGNLGVMELVKFHKTATQEQKQQINELLRRNDELLGYAKDTKQELGNANVKLDRIEKTQRMSNGSLRKIWIADKKNISSAWNSLPTYSTLTVDGGMGAEDIRAFYLNKGKGTFKVKISYNAVSTRDEIMLASFTSCAFSISKRNVRSTSASVPQEFWDVSFSIEEV